MKRILILHEFVPKNAPADIQDVLVQANAVYNACLELGYQPYFQPVTSDLTEVETFIKKTSPDVVFNLVESIDGQSSFMNLVPELLTNLKIPFTGCNSTAMINTTDKTVTKRILNQHGVNTPAWLMVEDILSDRIKIQYPCIIKPIAEDGSCGINDASVCKDLSQVMKFLNNLSKDNADQNFIEQYIEGREFNAGLIADGNRVQVFPVSEIKFVNFPSGKPKILNYASKWNNSAFEFGNTERSFEFGPEDRELLEKISGIALKCWQMLDLSGYARVDLRVDRADTPWVLEVNANPCISPDSGYAAMAKQAGVTYRDMVGRIIDSAVN
jgi:D-alanine-D-alanine ligase